MCATLRIGSSPFVPNPFPLVAECSPLVAKGFPFDAAFPFDAGGAAGGVAECWHCFSAISYLSAVAAVQSARPPTTFDELLTCVLRDAFERQRAWIHAEIRLHERVSDVHEWAF